MRRTSLLVIFLTVFIDLVGFGIVLPLLPKYSERFGAHGFEIGLIISSFSLMQFLFSPLWGRLSDRVGRRPVLLISNAGSALSYGLFAVAPSVSGSLGSWSAGLWVLLASRVFAGICGANLAVASAYIADVTTTENRSKGMGLIGMAFGLGFILGPAIGGLSDAYLGLSGPGWVAAALCVVNFVFAWLVLGESRKPESESANRRPRWEQWRHTLSQPRLGLLIGIYFLGTFCFVSFESTLTLLLGSSSLHRDDLRDLPGLVSRLQAGQDPVSAHVRARLSERTRRVVIAQSPLPVIGASSRKLLLDDLNRLLESQGFYQPEAFAPVAMRESTRQLAAQYQGLRDEHLAHFNRLLLEDAYPREIARLRRYYDATRISYLFAYCGVIAVLIQGGAIGRLAKSLGEPRLVVGSLLLVGASLAVTPYMFGLAGILLALGLFSGGSGINRAPTMAMISMRASPQEQGATLGVAQGAGALARIVGPVLATTLYAWHKPLPYLICAAIAAVAAISASRALGWKHESGAEAGRSPGAEPPGVGKGKPQALAAR